ncbi:19198_t:CDS:2, partial [Racocetra persica]
DLKLTEEGRQLIFKGSLKRSNESSDLQVFLFDHALLMVKVKIVNKVEQYKIYRRPIPIELLKVSTEESHSESSQKRTQSILPGKSPTTNRGSINHRYPLTFSCLGKKGFTENLYALTMVSRKRWIDLISEQKEVIDKNKSFEKTILIEKGQFSGANKINCAAFYDNYRNLIIGTDSGVYVIEIGQRQNPALVLQVEKVSQIEILEEHQLLLVLA